MPCNVFQLRGYRGEHRQYYYLTPIFDYHGNLVDKYYRENTRDCNEWLEPECNCYVHKEHTSCKICERPSVFADSKFFRVPSRGRSNQDWRQDYFSRNDGKYYHIWDESEKQVRINMGYLGGRGGGVLSNVKPVSTSEVEEVISRQV